ncbi:MAG: hypothetical protein ABI797_01060 [Chloroflexota bacterium]
MSRRNQSHRRRTYGRRQHEVKERRSPDAPGEGEAWARDETWGDWTNADSAPDQQTTDDGSYRSYAR